MINAINIPQQIVQPQNNVLFAENRVRCGAPIKHDAGSGLFTINRPGLYKVFFNANILATVANQQTEFAVKQNGEAILAADVKNTLTAIGNYRSVAVEIPIRVFCDCCTTISIANLSTLATTVENANIIIERVG